MSTRAKERRTEEEGEKGIVCVCVLDYVHQRAAGVYISACPPPLPPSSCLVLERGTCCLSHTLPPFAPQKRRRRTLCLCGSAFYAVVLFVRFFLFSPPICRSKGAVKGSLGRERESWVASVSLSPPLPAVSLLSYCTH